MDSEYFICSNCQKKVSFKAPGTHHRNHCPYCLCSLHVDAESGDRKSECHGIMNPIGKFYKKKDEEVLVHKCSKCGFIRYNRIAGDDSFSLVDGLQVIPIDDLPNL